MACLAAEGSKVARRARVCRQHFDAPTGLQYRQRFLGAQDWQRAFKAAGVDL
jgi:hypothetical protein